MQINRDRLIGRLMELGEIGRNPDTGGLNRLALTPSEREATARVIDWMEQAGLEVRTDPCGNVFGAWNAGTEAGAVWSGSHVDSVPEGGIYDGPLGVLGALEAVQTLKEQGHQPVRPIEVVSFLHEEGSRFGGGLTGSKIAMGELDRDGLDQKVDDTGVSLAQALAENGLDPDGVDESRYSAEQVHAYLELHIEQGPVLEAADLPVGVVNRIAGPLFVNAKIFGTAAHAGACPMQLRKDPMIAAARFISALEELPPQFSNTAVATVGRIHAHPGARNVIPAWVEFTIDIRDVDEVARERLEASIRELLDQIVKERGLRYEWEEVARVEPIGFWKQVISACQESARDAGIASQLLASGAAHDAMVMSRQVPAGMLFVRSRNGISHSPDEFSTEDDIVDAVTVLTGALRILSA